MTKGEESMSRMADHIDDILIESIQKDFGYDYDQAKEILDEIRWRIADKIEEFNPAKDSISLRQPIDEIILDYLNEYYLEYAWIFTDN